MPLTIDFGGDLPPLSELHDPLHGYANSSSPASRRRINEHETPTTSETPSNLLSLPSSIGLDPNPSMRQKVKRTLIPATSSLNPFYGYPAWMPDSSSTTTNTPVPRHGRRRKRDLMRTLATLWWIRWRKHLTAVFGVVVVTVLLMLGRKFDLIRLVRRNWLRPTFSDAQRRFTAIGLPALGLILASENPPRSLANLGTFVS